MDPVHWKDPEKFNPDRYKSAPTSHDINEEKVRADRLRQMPVQHRAVRCGRRALPVCDYAGFAPFGFGYRRCQGEQLTIQVFEDFPRKVWRERKRVS